MILVVNGPNINLLQEREKRYYGGISADRIKQELEERAECEGYDLRWMQSNSLGKIVDYLHQHREKTEGIIINPAAYSHTGLALQDCLAMLDIPVIEVHISNPAARERKLLTASAADGVIMGLGIDSYRLAYEALKNLI